MAIKYGYNINSMDVSIAEAKNRLTELIRAVEDGERVVITRHGKPVAQLSPAPPERRKVPTFARLGCSRRSRSLPRRRSVNGCLLDTNVALIALTEPDTLSPAVRRAVLSGPNFLSVVSYWEVMLKSMKGNLKVGDPRTWWLDALEQLAATPLALRAEHVAGVFTLAQFHKDPFDRILIAQAIAEDLKLVTTDSEIPRYASGRFRVVS